MDPNSKTPLVILFIKALFVNSTRLFILKSGKETKDITSPLSESINKDAAPSALKISNAFSNSFLIRY